MNQDSAFSIVNKLQAGGLADWGTGLWFPVGAENFLISMTVRQALWLFKFLFSGYGISECLLSGKKRLEHKLTTPRRLSQRIVCTYNFTPS
jgi:hypothetical protein